MVLGPATVYPPPSLMSVSFSRARKEEMKRRHKVETKGPSPGVSPPMGALFLVVSSFRARAFKRERKEGETGIEVTANMSFFNSLKVSCWLYPLDDACRLLLSLPFLFPKEKEKGKREEGSNLWTHHDGFPRPFFLSRFSSFTKEKERKEVFNPMMFPQDKSLHPS